MPRKFGGVMALLAMTLTLVRAIRHGQGFESTIVVALSWMAAMWVVGWIVGAIAQSTVDESVRLTMEQQLVNRQA